MKPHILALITFIIALGLPAPHALAQTPALENTALNVAPGPLDADSFVRSGSLLLPLHVH
jgi:hypothetical protein